MMRIPSGTGETSPVPPCSVNVILLGHAQAGKTSILRAIQHTVTVNGDHHSKSDLLATAAASTAASFAVQHRLESDGLVWRFTDVPGQVEYFSAYSHFVSIPSAIILIVCSLKRALKKNSNGRVEMDRLVLLEEFKVWCSPLNQLIKSGKRRRDSKVFLVVTHLDLLEENEIELNGERLDWEKLFGLGSDAVARREVFDIYWKSDFRELAVYEELNLFRAPRICLNATLPAEVHSELWNPILLPVAESLLKAHTTLPNYFHALNSDFLKLQEEIFPLKPTSRIDREAGHSTLYSSIIRSDDDFRSSPPYLPYSDAVKLFREPPFSLDSDEKCQEIISIFLRSGDIIQLEIGQKILILSPSWLNHVISAVVMPAASSFNGVTMDNGAISYSSLQSFLMKTYPLRSGIRLFQTENLLRETLNLLSELDILIHPADIPQQHLTQLQPPIPLPISCSSSFLNNANFTSPEKELNHQQIFIPSRIELPSLKFMIPDYAHVYGRRQVFPNSRNLRFPPATIPLLVCWLGAFSERLGNCNCNWEDDCARNAVRLRLSGDSQALIYGDRFHRWLDIIIWARSTGLSTVAKFGPKLVSSVKSILSFTGRRFRCSTSFSCSNEKSASEQEDYLDEERLCGPCIIEAWQAGGLGFAAQICVIPAYSSMWRDGHEGADHTDTQLSLLFPTDQQHHDDRLELEAESESATASSLYSIDSNWDPEQLKLWMFEQQPGLYYWFWYPRYVLDVEMIIELKKLSWQELETRLRDWHKTPCRSVRLYLMEYLRLVQINDSLSKSRCWPTDYQPRTFQEVPE